MRNTLLAVFAFATLAAITAGCGANRISASTPPDAAFEAGDASFSFNYDGDIPDLPRRGGTQQQPRITPDANRPMAMQVATCPMNPQGAACATDGQVCRILVRNQLETCFCTQGTYRCPGLPAPRPDAGAPVDARPDTTTARPDATPDTTRG